MKTVVKVIVVALFIAFAIPIGLWVGYTQLKGYSSNPLTYSSCITTSEAKFSDVAGWDFEVEDTNCDTLAKDEAVRVFAVRSDANRSSWIRFLARRRLVFQYDPWNQDELVPSITATGKDDIMISIPRVSYIYEQNRLIGHTAVAYDVRKVEYR